MPEKLEPRGGLYYGWDLGEDGWKDRMDQNQLRIGRVLAQLSVQDRDLTAPPGSPADGDTYIVGTAATGDWSGQDDDVAVWDDTGSAWVFYTPRIGWLTYIEDEEVLSVFKVAGWSTGISI